MTDVIKVEFGKEAREHARRFARLIGLLDRHAEDVLRDPISHMGRASKVIADLRIQIHEARVAWERRNPITNYTPTEDIMAVSIDTIVVPKRDWDALQEMRRIIEKEI